MIDNPANIDPRKFLKAATASMKGICKSHYEAYRTFEKNEF